MYLDAGHAGWLGWPANIGPAATMFGDLYKAAGSPSQVRGLATNVANYNAWSVTTCASYTQGDPNCDEQKYINALAPLLTAAGFPAHFISMSKPLPIFLIYWEFLLRKTCFMIKTPEIIPRPLHLCRKQC